MNYYNPYFYNIPSAASSAASPGLFKSLLGKGINWGSFLSNTQKVIGIANQAIPVVKQISPVMKNAKTMFKVMNEFKKVDTPTEKTVQKGNTQKVVPPSTVQKSSSVRENQTVSNVQSENPVIVSNDNGPRFFI